MNSLKLLFIFLFIQGPLFAQSIVLNEKVNLVSVGKGWAKNSVNANILRHNSLATYKNTQYIAYYNEQKYLVVGKRKIDSKKWTLSVSKYQGKVEDAHRTISLIVDGDGYLHVSWDHHVNKLRYCKSLEPGSLELSEEISMTGLKEQKVTYPEFYNLPNGDLFFVYRDGTSGNGSMILNRYDVKNKNWTQLQDGWINGEGERSPYWQITTDKYGTIHISWVWRETPNVASNHDICYARSKDGGITWEKSTGEKYKLPITASTAEYAVRIPQNSELINTTSIAIDSKGRPYTATYWRNQDSKIPQYHLVYNDGNQWITQQISNRQTPFSLSGAGTKKIPISRPQLILKDKKDIVKAILIYRDIEQQERVSVSISNNISKGNWNTRNLTTFSVGSWEPAYDTTLWQKTGKLHLFVQNVAQGDSETIIAIDPQDISVLEWKPEWK